MPGILLKSDEEKKQRNQDTVYKLLVWEKEEWLRQLYHFPCSV